MQMVYSLKKSSLLQLIEKIVLILLQLQKLKYQEQVLIKMPIFCQSYELIGKEKKRDGLYISTCRLLTDTCLIEKGNDQIDCKNIS